MRRIALPVESDKLSCCFEQCKKFIVFDIKYHSIINKRWIDAPSFEPKALSGWLLGNGITDIIVNRIKQEVVKVCNSNKVHVFVGVQKGELNELVQDFIDGILVTNGEMVEN